MNDPALYISYTITEIFCIFFSVGIIIKANKNVGTDLQMRHFRGMALFFIIYLLSDSYWALGQGGLIPFNSTMNKVTNAIGLTAVGLLTLGWCIFVIYRIDQDKSKEYKKLMIMHYTVAAVDCLITVTSVFTGFYFYIDENEVFQFHPAVRQRYLFVRAELFKQTGKDKKGISSAAPVYNHPLSHCCAGGYPAALSYCFAWNIPSYSVCFPRNTKQRNIFRRSHRS